MKKRRISILIWLLAFIMISTACQPLLEAPLEAQIPGLVHTLAVQTMAANQELRPLLEAPTQTFTPVKPAATATSLPATPTTFLLPTFTPFPTLTPGGIEDNTTNTDTMIADEMDTGEANPRNDEGKLCNSVQFIQDITYEDGTPVEPGEEFTKIWQVKNIGNCTWTPDYSLVVVWGDEMGTRPPVPLNQVVQPGEVTEISMDMKAPYLPACYFTYWMMLDPKGNKFGTGSTAHGNFWVNISVTTPFLDKIPGLKKFIPIG